MPGETEMTATAQAGQAAEDDNDVEAQNNGDGDGGGGGDDGSEDEEERKKQEAEHTLWTRIWIGIAAVSIIFACLAMAIVQETVVIVAGIIAIVVSLIVIKFQFELQDTDSLRRVQNEIRDQVNDFAVENQKLSNSNNKLEQQLEPLKETEVKLKKIAEENGYNVDKLQNMVKENQNTINQMRKLVEDDVIYEMIDAVLDSERSEDGEFDDKEIRMLALRLSGLPAVKMNRDLFVEKVKQNRNVNAVVDLIRTIHDKNIPDKDRVFEVDDDYDPRDFCD